MWCYIGVFPVSPVRLASEALSSCLRRIELDPSSLLVLCLWSRVSADMRGRGFYRLDMTDFLKAFAHLCLYLLLQLGSVQSLSRVRLFVTPWIAARQAPCPWPTPRVYSNSVYRVSDAIQPSHPLSSPSPPAPNPSQHQGLFQWVKSSHAVAKVLEFQLQHQSFQWTPRTDLL